MRVAASGSVADKLQYRLAALLQWSLARSGEWKNSVAPPLTEAEWLQWSLARDGHNIRFELADDADSAIGVVGFTQTTHIK